MQRRKDIPSVSSMCDRYIHGSLRNHIFRIWLLFYSHITNVYLQTKSLITNTGHQINGIYLFLCVCVYTLSKLVRQLQRDPKRDCMNKRKEQHKYAVISDSETTTYFANCTKYIVRLSTNAQNTYIYYTQSKHFAPDK